MKDLRSVEVHAFASGRPLILKLGVAKRDDDSLIFGVVAHGLMTYASYQVGSVVPGHRTQIQVMLDKAETTGYWAFVWDGDRDHSLVVEYDQLLKAAIELNLIAIKEPAAREARAIERLEDIAATRSPDKGVDDPEARRVAAGDILLTLVHPDVAEAYDKAVAWR